MQVTGGNVYTGIMLFLAAALVLLNGMFVAAEFAFVKVRKTQLELLSAEGNRTAGLALFGVQHLDAYLSVCQLGITLASLGLGWLGEPAVASVLRSLLVHIPYDNPALFRTVSFVIGFTLITLAHVVFGELAPKSISIQMAEKVALFLARPMRVCYTLCYPLVVVMNGISNAVLRLVGIAPATESEQTHSPEELRMLILDSSMRGRLDKDEGRMLDNIFSFYQKTAKDVMQHRMDVVALDAADSREKALDVARESGHTRYPVYEDNRDNLIGFIHVRDLLLREDMANVREVLRIPAYAPESLPLEKLMDTMRAERQQFCVVLDEYGVWQGILSMEDIVEAIVGTIQDEFDNETPDVIAEPDGSYSVSGDLSLDDLAEYMPLECAPGTDVYKILAAHFIEALDRIPEQGDSIELCDKRFTITAMDRNRVRRVRVEALPPGQTEGAE